MTDQIKQIVRVYATNRTLWVVAGFAALTAGPMTLIGLFTADSRRDTAPLALFAVGFGMGALGWVLVLQAKWQFCNPRSRLLPGFARPHLTVLVGLMLAGVGAYPIAIAAAGGWNPLGTAACASGLAASVIWAIHGQNMTAVALAAGQFLSLISPVGLDFWVLPDHAASYAAAHAAILAAGWIALVAWARRLPLLREEDRDYAIPIQVQQGSATRMERTQVARATARQLGGGKFQQALSDRWHDRLANVRATTPAARQWLLRYGFSPLPLFPMAVVMALVFFGMLYAMSRWSIMAGGGSRNATASLPMIIMMPGIMVGGALILRRGRLAQELCLPLSRRQLFTGLFAVAAGNAVLAGVVSQAAAIGLIAATDSARLVPRFVAGLIALSIGVQLFTFGILIWVSRLTSGGARNVLMMVALIPAFALLPLGFECLPRPLPPPDAEIAVLQESLATASMSPETRLLAEQRLAAHLQSRESQRGLDRTERAMGIALGLAAAGALILWDARRRWLRLDLG